MSEAAGQQRMEDALARARRSREADLADLMDELRIPSVSTLPERRADCVANAEWLKARLARLGFEARLVEVIEDGLPVVVAEWNGAPGKPHLTIYGHYDVQPPDPLELWNSPPFEPAVRDGQLYARGCADNKGNHMTAVKAVEHLVESGGLPVNVRFLIEGEEEISGRALPRYLRENAKQLGTDAVLVWDSGFDEAGRPTLATALRGLLYLELHARGPSVDVHSGIFGGVVPNPINTLARIIGELKDRDGRVTIPGFYDKVRPPSRQELEAWRQFEPKFAAEAMRMSGARALEGEPDYMAIERAGSRPTLDVNGILGGFVGEGQKTVIPAAAFAKISTRLVPDQDWKTILESFEAYVQTLTTPGVELRVDLLSAAPPVTCSVDHPAAKALTDAFRDAFGKETALVRMGGSIPVAVDFQEALGAPLVISGIEQADAAIHSPNEHLAIDQYYTGIEALIRFMCHLGERGT
jgi:acetylornithine deacetylase/succinyl-diaminopimelate desuccinylase-like protein